jgi:hypothetical protein
MAVCNACGERFFFRPLTRRLAVPEYRMLTGFWPWLQVRVCDDCLEAYDREFTERLRLLAPGVLENGEPVAQPVCLSCATIEPHGVWQQASRWVDANGRPARKATFYLCHRHRDLPYVEGIVVASNLASLARMKSVMNELPVAGGDLLQRVEGWRPETGKGPPGSTDFTPARHEDDVAPAALAFWQAAPPGLEAKGAWLGPVRKDYRLRYRLDLAHDLATGVRETLTVVRTARDGFATYRTTAKVPAK